MSAHHHVQPPATAPDDDADLARWDDDVVLTSRPDQDRTMHMEDRFPRDE
jgi:hypothetical protein